MDVNFCLFLLTIMIRYDLIECLPDISTCLNYQQYSGYLSGTEDGNIQLHYWLVKSFEDQDKTPLVLWFNGGPGCSSVTGLVYENGPFMIDPNGTVYDNKYSWNEAANMLYLESPACVGFSYAKDGNCATNDELTAAWNLAALQHFIEKFPEYQTRDLYLTGESYAGIYIPMLAVKILASDLATNLKVDDMHCQEMFDNMEDGCAKAVDDANIALMVRGPKNLNIYNILGDCAKTGNQTAGELMMAYDSLSMMFSHSPHMASFFADRNSYRTIVNCFDSKSAYDYFNREDVKKALHIVEGLPPWDICWSDRSLYEKQVESVEDQFKELLRKKVRILIYYGDLDLVCTFLGGYWFVSVLGIKPVDEYHTWDVDGQIGGRWQSFGGLQYVTVRGAGHMVPTDKPKEALHLFRAFLNNAEL